MYHYFPKNIKQHNKNQNRIQKKRFCLHNMCMCAVNIYYAHIYTVGTESIQTPLNFSLFVILQPFAKII